MDLPEELWCHIIGYATDLDSTSRHDFAEHLLPPFSGDSLTAKRNISVVSHKFHRISKPYLYESIVIDSRKALNALEHTLAHSRDAEESASYVRMLHITINEWDMVDVRDAMSDVIPKILGHTSDLKALHILMKPRELERCERMVLFARCVPSSIESLTWHIPCAGKLAETELHNALSACSTSLRSLSLNPNFYGSDIHRIIEPMSSDFALLTHLELQHLYDSRGWLRAFLQRSAVSHITVKGFRLFDLGETWTYPSITTLSVTSWVDTYITDLKSIFPELATLIFPAGVHSEWLRRICHSSLRIIVLDNRHLAMHQMLFKSPWSYMWQTLESIAAVRFPSLESVVVRLHDEEFSEGFWTSNSAIIERASTHIRNAGISVDVRR